MNSIAMAQAVQNACKPKFHGQNTLKSKVVTRYPHNLEREYTRITNAYMALLNKTLAEHLPTIRRAIDAERANMRQDEAFDVFDVTTQTFVRIQSAFERRAASFGLERRITNLSNMARRVSVREWRRVVRNTLGINILEDYYMGEFFRGALRQWVTSNIDLIKSVPRSTLNNMQNIVQDGFLSGKSNTAIGNALQEAYGISRRKAQFWARDQVASLNSDLTQQQHKDAGVDEYTWSDSDDKRVREDHKNLNGKRCKWSDPTVYYDERATAWVPRRTDMVKKHPGKDYNCRCVGLPRFNLPELSLPWEGGEQS